MSLRICLYTKDSSMMLMPWTTFRINSRDLFTLIGTVAIEWKIEFHGSRRQRCTQALEMSEWSLEKCNKRSIGSKWTWLFVLFWSSGLMETSRLIEILFRHRNDNETILKKFSDHMQMATYVQICLVMPPCNIGHGFPIKVPAHRSFTSSHGTNSHESDIDFGLCCLRSQVNTFFASILRNIFFRSGCIFFLKLFFLYLPGF